MSSKGKQRMPTRPSFGTLPLRQGDPKASAWGLWGAHEELGTLNLLTPDVVRRVAEIITTGGVVILR
jgi:hypothetical protein